MILVITDKFRRAQEDLRPLIGTYDPSKGLGQFKTGMPFRIGVVSNRIEHDLDRLRGLKPNGIIILNEDYSVIEYICKLIWRDAEISIGMPLNPYYEGSKESSPCPECGCIEWGEWTRIPVLEPVSSSTYWIEDLTAVEANRQVRECDYCGEKEYRDKATKAKFVELFGHGPARKHRRRTK